MYRRIEEYSQFDPEVLKSRYCPFATELYTVIVSRFPMGAVNRFDRGSQLPFSELKEQLDHLASYDTVAKEQVRRSGAGDLIECMKDIRYASCEIMASYAQGYMLHKHPDIKTEVMYLNEHAMLVIGREAGSDPNNIMTWGNDTIICDYWAELLYLSQHFFAVRAQVPNVTFCLKVLDKTIGALKSVIESSQHYLEGNPTIYVSAASKKYDVMFTRWVAKDLPMQESLSSAPVSLMPPPAAGAMQAPVVSLFAAVPQWLLTKYKLDNDSQASLEQGLRRAASTGCAADLAIFIRYVRDVNAQDGNSASKKTALHWAALNGHEDCYQALIVAKARDNIEDAQGKMAVTVREERHKTAAKPA